MKREAAQPLPVLCSGVSAPEAMEFISLIRAYHIIPEIVPIEHADVRSDGDIDPPILPIERSGEADILKDNILNCTNCNSKNACRI